MKFTAGLFTGLGICGLVFTIAFGMSYGWHAKTQDAVKSCFSSRSVA